MSPELKAAWIADLLAHPELQGRGALRYSNNTFCCLGRLRDVAGLEWIPHGKWFCTPGGRTDLIDNAELYELGLCHSQQERLAGMNDDGISFAEIADWIEANL